jgi:hypothetical protein
MPEEINEHRKYFRKKLRRCAVAALEKETASEHRASGESSL